jgi:hypothetical protein
MTGLAKPSAETQQGGGTPAPLSNFWARLDTLSR